MNNEMMRGLLERRSCRSFKPEQITENVRALDAPPLTGEELSRIGAILSGQA